MKKYKFKISGQIYEVEVGDFNGSNATISVNGTPYEVELQSDTAKPTAAAFTPKAVAADAAPIKANTAPAGTLFKVASPLPGSVFKLNVSVGDTVKVGDCLLVMEAMKMENNIMAEKGGVVQSIKVQVGSTVLQGDILMEIAQ